ncbi:Fc.00g115080.m01.CDS01 [Cosmosporella sp. VM-42]
MRRLCTTHLESLWEGKDCRLAQLATISELLKATTISGYKLVAGLVGGDMNAIGKSEHDYHRADKVKLDDIWEELPPPPVPKLGPLQQDQHCGKEKGSTWGYQPFRRHDPKRLDKFLYTGSIGTLPVINAQDALGKNGLVGVGLRTKVEAWELEREEIVVVRGNPTRRSRKEYVSEERYSTLNNLGFLQSYKARRAHTLRLHDSAALLNHKILEAETQWRHTPKLLKKCPGGASMSFPDYIDAVLAASWYRRLREGLELEVEQLLNDEPRIVVLPEGSHVGKGLLRWSRTHVQDVYERHSLTLDLLEVVKVPLKMQTQILTEDFARQMSGSTVGLPAAGTPVVGTTAAGLTAVGSPATRTPAVATPVPAVASCNDDSDDGKSD